MSEPGQESQHWLAASSSARLGLPVAPGERHRLVKRAVTRLFRPILRHQVVYNVELLAELATIRDSLLGEIRALDERTAQFATLVAQVKVLSSQLDQVSSWLGGVHSRVEEIWVDRDLVHQEVELARQQTLDRLEEALGGIREGLRDLGEKTEETRREAEEALGRVARP